MVRVHEFGPAGPLGTLALSTRDLSDTVRAIPHGVVYGGYDLAALMADAGWLCYSCVKDNAAQIWSAATDAARDGCSDDQWTIVAFETSDMLENYERCEHCNRLIDAYHSEGDAGCALPDSAQTMHTAAACVDG